MLLALRGRATLWVTQKDKREIASAETASQ